MQVMRIAELVAMLLGALVACARPSWGGDARPGAVGGVHIAPVISAADSTSRRPPVNSAATAPTWASGHRRGDALAASLAGTLVPIGIGIPMCRGWDWDHSTGTQRAGLLLIGAGLVAGPSLGYYVNGDFRRANREILVHLAIASVTAGGFATMAAHDVSGQGVFLLFGTFYLLAHAGTDIAEVGRRSNRGVRMTLVPLACPKPGLLASAVVDL